MEFNFIEFDWSGLPSGKLNGIIDPTYRKLIKQLEEDYNGSIDRNDILKTRENKRNLLRKFAEVYMMPWEFWVNLFCNHGCFSASQKGYMILSFVPYCFVYTPPYYAKENVEKNFQKLRHILKHISWTTNKFKDMNKAAILVKNMDMLIENLNFPHCYLDKLWILYEKNVCMPPSKKMVETYQKMKNLHEKLESLKGVDDNLWFATLLEVEDYDVEFVEQMIEYQIGRDLSNQKLWQLYFNFLKRRNNTEKLLKTYSKYCRFYLDDNEMKKEYQIAVQKYGIFEVPWKNPFDFEVYTENAKERWRDPVKKEDNRIIQKPAKNAAITYFSTEKIFNQNFAFRNSFIFYIIQTSPAFLRQKLYKSCKYFFAKYSVPIIYKFVVNEDPPEEEISQDSIQLANTNKLKSDIYISTVFIFNVKTSANSLSRFIPNINQCKAKYMEIYNQNLTFNEMKFLIGHGNVTELTLEKCVIAYDDNDETLVPLENILELTPKLQYIKIRFPKISCDTAQNLMNLEFLNKFYYIHLYNLTTDLEPYTFVEFLNKNVLSDCEIHLFDKENLKAGNLFKTVRTELCKKWKNCGPRFGCGTLQSDFDILH